MKKFTKKTRIKDYQKIDPQEISAIRDECIQHYRKEVNKFDLEIERYIQREDNLLIS
jgi:hypothetical protein